MAQRVLARLRRGAVVVTTVALGFGLAPAVVAVADPVATDPGVSEPAAEPTTSAEAQAAWLQATEDAEALNEQVLLADEKVTTSAAAVDAANGAVTNAVSAVAAAEQAKLQAQAVVESYSEKLDSFANASFRGARMSQLSSLLTAESADDFLDSVTALDRVAGETSQLLLDARDAKAAADAAAAAEAASKAQAEIAQQQAVTANAEAVAAQGSLAASKTELDAKVVQYRALYDQLTEAERQAAIAAEEARLAALAAAAAAQAAAATGPAGGATPSVTPPTTSPTTPSAPTPTVVAPNAAAQAAVDAALSKVGARYVFGSAGPTTFDCSGLTSWAWKQAGVTIPRTSSGQSGLPYVPLDQLQPGDLITYYSPVHHVAMYIGNGQIVHASTESKPVYVTTIAKGGPNPTGHRVR